jgi:hypothetical protein
MSNMEDAEDPVLGAYQKRPFPEVLRRVRWQPQGELQIIASGQQEDCRFETFDADGFLEAAKVLAEHLAAGTLPDAPEGIAALYLFRHYLELKLKLVRFHAWWLKKGNWNENAPDDEIGSIKDEHRLQVLWEQLRSEIDARIPLVEQRCFDLDYLSRCVTVIHALDPDGQRLRYPVRTIQVATEPVPACRLIVDWASLVDVMQHAQEVLDSLDGLVVNQHGFNREWEAEQNSW